MKLKPCPCCASDRLYHGPASAMSYGVQCMTCRLMVERHIPPRWPRGMKSIKSPKRRMAMLERFILKQAVDAWNTRR